MAVTACRECGGQVSDRAAACPHCGAKPRKKTSPVAWVIVGLFVLAAVKIGTSGDSPAPPPAQASSASATKVDKAASRAATWAVRLRDASRKPESFRLDHATVIDGTEAVCYEYRAENGFGGTNREKAVLDSNTGEFKRSGNAGFDALWDRECGGKSGRDVANAIRMFAL